MKNYLFQYSDALKRRGKINKALTPDEFAELITEEVFVPAINKAVNDALDKVAAEARIGECEYAAMLSCSPSHIHGWALDAAIEAARPK